jgi:hypothetical protein
MGILDDAIREHLDLKRRQGAADDELKRLEDEAFGPPTRPGEPDFPDAEGEGEPQVSGNGSGEGRVAEDVGTAEPTDEGGTEAAAPAAETVPVEPPPVEEPPPVGPRPVEEPPPPPVEEPPPVEHQEEPASDEQTAFYDHGEEGGLEVGDVELELDEEAAEVTEIDESPLPGEDTVERPVSEPAPSEAESAGEPPIESLDTAEHEPPIESLDTVEHQIEEVEGEPVEESITETPGGEQPGEEEGEDVLEETPEFLRDAPEDDELWFEQGEPKDFDF